MYENGKKAIIRFARYNRGNCGRLFCIYGISDMKKGVKAIDYRHFICAGITLAFLLVSVFVFPSAFGRIIESVRDFGLSIAFYFSKMFGVESNITATVNDLPKMPFFNVPNMPESPIPVLPESFELFKESWHLYWAVFATTDNCLRYLSFLGKVLGVIAIALLYIIPIVMVVYFLQKNRSIRKTTITT